MVVIKRKPRAKQRIEPDKSGAATLQALTAAALTLPGLMPATVQAAEEEASFSYGYYDEGKRYLAGLKSRFTPITVDSLLGRFKLGLTDRLKFNVNYIQDTWTGATPIATAPESFMGNRESGTISGATPYLVNDAVFFDRALNPLIFDSVTNSYVRDKQLVHTLSSASPETRNQGDFKLTYDWDEAALDVGGGISVERDYESRYGSLGGRWDFNQKLTTLNAGLSYTNSDTHAILDHDATPYIWETSRGFRTLDKSAYNFELTKTGGNTLLEGNRQDWAFTLGLTQVLNDSALIEFGVGYTRSTGYMSNPYKTVDTAFVAPNQQGEILRGETIGFLEKRPDERNQFMADIRYVQYIDPLDAALHFDYRFFHDDWGIDAHTFEADWVQPLDWGWTVTPKVRYYSQSAADFYYPYLVTLQTPQLAYDAGGNILGLRFDPSLLPTQYSSDHRLSGYGAISGGITLSKQFAKGISLEASAEYYSHAGSLKLGGGGEGFYSDFDYYMVNGTLKVDLSALSAGLANSMHGEHHNHHAHHGAHAPAGVMFDHMLDKTGDMMVGVRYMRGTQGGTTLHGTNKVGDQEIVNAGCSGAPCYYTPDGMSMNMIMLDVMYAPTDWLTLMLMPQFVDMSMTTRELAGAPPADFDQNALIIHHTSHAHETGGVGDTGMYAMFKLFNTSMHHLHATLGVTAPTGDVDIMFRDTHRLDVGFQHYEMQLGSGTWDFKPSLTYTGSLDKYSWGAQLNGTVRLESINESGFSFGDNFQVTAWGSYDLLHWLSASVRGVYTLQGSVDGQYNGTFNALGTPDFTANTGGRYWDVGFGLSAFVPSGDLQGNRLSFEWLQPVSNDVNGYQLPRQGALAATWSYAF